MDQYREEAMAKWGDTPEYKEYEEKAKNRNNDENQRIADGLMAIFQEFGKIKGHAPEDQAAQELVAKLQGYITEHYYRCENSILLNLGTMYTTDSRFTKNIDDAGGKGTASFVNQAIRHYCKL